MTKDDKIMPGTSKANLVLKLGTGALRQMKGHFLKCCILTMGLFSEECDKPFPNSDLPC